MIDPDNPTNFDRTDAELEEWLLFCVLASFRNGHAAAGVLAYLLQDALPGESPFDTLLRTNASSDGYWPLSAYSIRLKLAAYGFGLEHQKACALAHALAICRGIMPGGHASRHPLNLRTVSADALENIPMVGHKTSRLFLLHSRRDANVAALDVHVLRHMRVVWGYDVPEQTPQSEKNYRAIEALFLAKASQLNKHPAELDIAIWRSRRVGPGPKVKPAPGAEHGSEKVQAAAQK